MIKFMYVFVLLAVSCLAIPVEEHPKLSRPSPINPDVTSDPKPAEVKEVLSSSSTVESHIQKVPAAGVKLSVEVAKNEETSSTSSRSSSTSLTTGQSTKNNPKRSVDSDSNASSKPPAFRRNQPSTTTEQPSSTTASSTTSSPVSVKTPVGTTRSKREVDITAATASSAGTNPTKRATTVAPTSNNDDKEGPHFVRPVPVDQILKNLNQQERGTGAATSEQHNKAEKSKDAKESDESSEEDPPKEEGTEQKAHQQTHPVIRQQGA
ncbi:uncharacterized protein LOC126560786 [Anopheles maculipalpis]|uniref:uncharacterized protein LOC126560786 n=1 Tax=Anopheles maculipalpis TaxID=1496333 RepID=UPI002159A049|nr:uncharacterized protein LOC126560786 [Anopheles maculipalpis]